MADHNDAVLLVQLAQWGTAMGIEDATLAVLSEDFDPESADANDPQVFRVLYYCETIGSLTKNGLLDTELLFDWLWVAGVWERVGPAAIRHREKFGQPDLWINFEELAQQQA